MGGRGGAGNGIGAGEPGRGRGMSLARFLSQQDINRANAASVTDMGDIIRRTFERNAAEINGLELSDAEKKDAVKQMATLATTALKTAAGAVNPYASGPARLTTAQKQEAPQTEPQERAVKWIATCGNCVTSPIKPQSSRKQVVFQCLCNSAKVRRVGSYGKRQKIPQG